MTIFYVLRAVSLNADIINNRQKNISSPPSACSHPITSLFLPRSWIAPGPVSPASLSLFLAVLSYTLSIFRPLSCYNIPYCAHSLIPASLPSCQVLLLQKRTFYIKYFARYTYLGFSYKLWQ